MSYARFSPESDVCVYAHVDGGLECCACRLRGGEENLRFATTDELLQHLREHQQAGHLVREKTFTGLEADRTRNDASSAGRPDQQASSTAQQIVQRMRGAGSGNLSTDQLLGRDE